jgi:hypothetical protein
MKTTRIIFYILVSPLMLNKLIEWLAGKWVAKFYKMPKVDIKKSVNIDGIEVYFGDIPESVYRVILADYLARKDEIESRISESVYKCDEKYGDAEISIDIEDKNSYYVSYHWEDYCVMVDIIKGKITDIMGGD